MGEARQRKQAKLAGTPWPEDIPNPPRSERTLGQDGTWHDPREVGRGTVMRHPGPKTLSIIAMVSALGVR